MRDHGHAWGRSDPVSNLTHLVQDMLTISHLVSKQLEKAKSAMKISRSQDRRDSDSADELASNALLDDPSAQLIRPSTQDSIAETFLARAKSGGSTTETSDKPLPSIPFKETTTGSIYQKQAKPALVPKTTNLKVPRNGRKQSPKPSISASSLPQGRQNSHNPTLTNVGQAARSNAYVASPQTSTADAAALSKKISDLMQQNAAKELKKRPKHKKSVKNDMSITPKPSPLERSKTAFAKATRAIVRRLSSTSEHPAKSKSQKEGNMLLNSIDDLPHPETGFLPPLSRGRLNRRIAEGENLGNPKIRDLMGHGHIPRKPLPVYESMKSPKRQSDSVEDPFSDGNELERAITPQTPVDLDFGLEIGLDIDFSRRKNKRTSRHEGFPFRGLSHTKSGLNFEPSLSAAESTSTFSNQTSGLAQHPEVEIFSSSPVGFSTPRIRLEPRPDADGKKRLTGVLMRSPSSILEFSFEDYETEDEPATPAGGSQLTDHEHSLSVKRKSAKEDLRARISPSNKKSRRISNASTEDFLTTEISPLDTQDHRPLLTKDTNARIARTNRERREVKGMCMSDTGPKGKAPIAAPPFRSRSTLSNRPSSISRPTSILFSRETRAHSRQLSTVEGDSMEIDELQMNV